MDEAISHYPEKEQGELLNIVGYFEVAQPCMFWKGVYFSVFYCFCYEMDIYKDILEYQVSEERDLDLNEEEDIILDTIREEHWRDVAE